MLFFTSMVSHNEDIKYQLNLRSKTFETSVHWVRDPKLIAAHIKMAGKPAGKALDLCCGTGAVARGLNAAGWDITGIDKSEGRIAEASKHVHAVVGDVRHLPYSDQSIDLVVMRQAYSRLEDGPAVLSEIRRVLKPGGKFILSHSVPASDADEEHLEKVHAAMQTQTRKFHTVYSLTSELMTARFMVTAKANVTVRESVSLWMQEAHELSEATRQEVCRLVAQAPDEYRRLRNVQVVRGEILEDWNFALLLAVPEAH